MKQTLAVALGLSLVLLYFIPWFSSEPSMLPSTYPDAWAFVWNIDRLADVWNGGESLYFTNRIFHPFGTSLALHTQVEGISLPAAILTGVVGVESAYTFSVIVCFVLNYLAFFMLFFSLSSSAIVSVWLALVLTFHPQFIGHLDGGHLNFLCFFPLVFWLRSYLLLLEEGEGEAFHYMVLAFTTAFTAFTNLYYLVFIAGLGVVLTLLSIGGSSWKRTERVFFAVMASTCGLLLAAGKLWYVVQSYASEGFKSNHAPSEHSADILFSFIPSSNQAIGAFSPFSLSPYFYSLSPSELGVYCGISLFILVLLFLSRKVPPRMSFPLFGAALFFFFLSLGPVVRVGGHRLFDDPLYDLLLKTPIFPSVPIRFGFLSVLLLTCIVALGFQQKLTRLPVLFVLTFAIECLPVSLPLGPMPQSEALLYLRGVNDVLAVHDFSVGRQHRLAHQLIHRKKITSAFVARAPLRPMEFYKENAFLRFIRRGKEVSKEELWKGVELLDIDAVICEGGKPSCSARVLETGLFKEIASDESFVVLGKKERRK